MDNLIHCLQLLSYSLQMHLWYNYTFFPSPLTINKMEQGLVGLTFVGCGILGGLAATAYLSKSKTENYDPILRIFMIISLVGLVLQAIKTINSLIK